MIVPFLDPPTPPMPELPQGGYYFCFTLIPFLCNYCMNRIKFMTSLHRLLNSIITLLHSLSNIFILYLLTIHNNDLVVACRRVWGVLLTAHMHYRLRFLKRFLMPVAKSISGWITPCPASISLSLIISVFLRSSTIADVS